MERTTVVTLAWELHQQGLSTTRIARHLGKHRETVGVWLAGIERHGLMAFLEQYQQAPRQPRPARQVDAGIKRWVWAIREREHGCCGQKIAYFLEREHGVKLSVPKIYEILAEKYVLRSKGKRKNVARGALPVAAGVREVVQMDSVMFGQVFAFTAVDTYSREADVLLVPELTARHGHRFLEQSLTRRFDGFVQLIQTDGGPEFKGDFLRHVGAFCGRHRVARPYKKNEQAFIESFNRTLRKECLGWSSYRSHDLDRLSDVVDDFLERYHHHRPHLAFDPLRPPLPRP